MLSLFQLLGLTSSDGVTTPPDPDPGPTTSTTPASRRITFVGTATAPTGATLPEGTRTFAEAVDPYDILDFEIDMSGLLETGEGITSSTLSVNTESALLGLTINTSNGYQVTRTGNILRFYLSITDADQNNKAFNTGIYLPLELRLVTNSIPPRRRQRTVAVRVVQR